MATMSLQSEQNTNLVFGEKTIELKNMILWALEGNFFLYAPPANENRVATVPLPAAAGKFSLTEKTACRCPRHLFFFKAAGHL